MFLHYKKIFFFAFFISSSLLATKKPGMNDYAQTQAAWNTIVAATTQPASIPQPCPSSGTCATPLPIPWLTIDLLNTAQTTTLNTINIQTDSLGFKINTALLTVDIYPPSNQIIATGVSFLAPSTYYVVYTLKTLDGLVLQKSIQPIQTPIPGILTLTSFPGAIKVYEYTTPAPLLPSLILPINFTTLLTTLKKQQQLFNFISPISQKFLIAQPLPITITNMSDMTYLLTPTTYLTLPPPPQTQGGTLLAINISITDTITPQILSLPATSFFNQGDLNKGIIADVTIYPPGFGLITAPADPNYFIIATFKSSDGLKLQTVTLPNITFVAPGPSQISFSYGPIATAPVVFTSNFFNAGSTQQCFNMLAPVTMRYLILGIIQNGINTIRVTLL